MSITAPCKNCTDRQLGCHSHCDKYIRYRNELNEYNRHVREEKSNQQMIDDFRIGNTIKYNEKKRKSHR